MHRTLGLLLVALLGCVVGCGGDDRAGDARMADHSYAGNRGVARTNALGKAVLLEQFEDQFVWADYAAPWCQPCRPQAQVIKRFETGWAGDDVVFLTVLTSKAQARDQLADQDTARAWSAQFGLDPARVLSAAVRRTLKLPTHVLYSPRGQTLLRMEGFRNEKQIRTMLSDAIDKYRRWEAAR